MKRALCILGVAFAVAACSNDPTVNPSGPDTTGASQTFIQVDREGNPGVKELFLPYGSHAGFDGVIPRYDPASYGSTVSSFVTTTGGRSAAIGSFAAALVLPDVLVANFNSTATYASYLGWQTNGAIPADCTGLPGTTFGGRALDDDVIDVDLGLAFGNLATSSVVTSTTLPIAEASAPPDDGNEKNGSNGTPNLTKQNVPCPSGEFSTTQFPYLAAPV